MFSAFSGASRYRVGLGLPLDKKEMLRPARGLSENSLNSGHESRRAERISTEASQTSPRMALHRFDIRKPERTAQSIDVERKNTGVDAESLP
jgi:hypothetical protein